MRSEFRWVAGVSVSVAGHIRIVGEKGLYVTYEVTTHKALLLFHDSQAWI
jgi:hypothetical protein